MEINKETRRRFNNFLIELEKEGNMNSRYFIILFRKEILLKKSLKKKLNVQEYNRLIKETELTSEIIYLIEETLLDERFSFIMGNLLNLLMCKKISISDAIVNKLCGYAFSNKMTSESIQIFCSYLGDINFEGHCDFFKKIIDMLRDKKDYMVGRISYHVAHMGCLNCYDSIKKILTSGERNGNTLYLTKEALKILDELKNGNK